MSQLLLGRVQLIGRSGTLRETNDHIAMAGKWTEVEDVVPSFLNMGMSFQPAVF